jgi:HlyD family secretion protein
MNWLVRGLVFTALITAVRCLPTADAVDVRSEENLVVRKDTYTEHLVLTGEVDAAVAETISVPRLPQWQTSVRWLAEEGAQVQEGAKVAELDTASFASDIDEKLEAVAEAQEKLRQHMEETSADLAEKEFDLLRRRNDLESAMMHAEVPEEIISRKEHEERQLQLKRAETELAKAEALLRAARESRAAEMQNLELDLAERRRQISISQQAIETMTLTAPTGGILVLNEHPWLGRKLEVGDNVWVGFQLARIPDLSTLQIRARLFDVDDGRIEAGMRAEVTIDAFPARKFGGRVAQVSSVAEEEGGRSLRRWFEVVIALDEADPATLRPGLSARVEIETRRLDDALIVPRRSLAIRQDGSATLALRNGGALEGVTLIGCASRECAVSGVEPGLALAPAAGLRSGS